MRPLARCHGERVEQRGAPHRALPYRVSFQRLDGPDFGGLGNADFAMIYLEPELGQESGLYIADQLLRLQARLGENMDLADLPERGGHHPGRKHPFQAGEQLLSPANPPRIRRALQRSRAHRGVGLTDRGRGQGSSYPFVRSQATALRPLAFA